MKMKLFSVIILCLSLATLMGCYGYSTPNALSESNESNEPSELVYDVPTESSTPMVYVLDDENNLMRNASAENSAFSFYIFDGEAVLSKIIFQNVSHRQSIIDELQSASVAKVTGWTLDDITLPIYGIQMGTSCGHGLWAAWSNGFWITQTGDVYRFDFDFEEFIKRQDWELPRSHTNFAWFPNAVFLTRDEEGWRDTLLIPAAKLNPPEGIEMAFVSSTNDSVTFTLTNSNDAYWMYGTPFKVDVLLGDTWYDIPKTSANWVFGYIGLILDAGQTETKTYNIAMYGDLPPGTYRLVKHDMYVVFEIN